MKQIIKLFTIALFAFSFNANSQTDFDLGRIKANTNISTIARGIDDQKERGTYTRELESALPIVVHVVHLGTPIVRDDKFVDQPKSQNISDEQIYSAIDNLNERFNNTWVPYWETPQITEPTLTTAPTARSVDAGIRFEFSKRSPSGDPTDGINRVNVYDLLNESGGEFGLTSDEISLYATNGVRSDNMYEGLEISRLKQLLAWDTDKYINIYVVNEFNNNDGGCGTMFDATYPNTELIGTPDDGIVIQWNRFGYGGFAHIIGGLNLELVEAMGTYLGLLPVYYGIESCEEAASEYIKHRDIEGYCENNGDYVCDTDPVNYVCTTLCIEDKCELRGEGAMPAGWTSPFDNYMAPGGSGFCKVKFTEGQSSRMEATILDMRSELVNGNNLALIQPNEFGLSLDLSVERTCLDEYKPVVFVTNVGNADEANYTINLYLDGSLKSTMNQDKLGPMPMGRTIEVEFPTLIIEDLGSHTISAEVEFPANRADGNPEDNSGTYSFVKTNEGFIDWELQYVSTLAGANIVIKKIESDGSRTVVFDGNKVQDNLTFQSNQKYKSENYEFNGYFRYGGILAEALGIQNTIAPWGTFFSSTATSVNNVGDRVQNPSARYYFGPGDYEVEVTGEIFSIGNQNWELTSPLFCDILDASTDGRICYVSLNSLNDLGTELNQLFYQSGGVVFNPADPADPSGGTFDGTDPSNLALNGSEIKTFAFTVPNEVAYQEACCVDNNGNGLCDVTENIINTGEQQVEVLIKNHFPNVDRVLIEYDISNNGISRIDELIVKVSTDQDFTNLVIDTIIPYKKINKEYFLYDNERYFWADNLTPNTQYWAQIIVDDRSLLSYSNVIDFTTNEDSCEGEDVLTYNDRDYELQPVGSQCWFKQNLQTKTLNNGTPIDSSTAGVDWATSFVNDNPAYAVEHWNDDEVLWNVKVGYGYNVHAATNPNICPNGWRVPTVEDFMQLDTIAGLISTAKKSVLATLYGGGNNKLGTSFAKTIDIGYIFDTTKTAFTPDDVDIYGLYVYNTEPTINQTAGSATYWTTNYNVLNNPAIPTGSYNPFGVSGVKKVDVAIFNPSINVDLQWGGVAPVAWQQANHIQATHGIRCVKGGITEWPDVVEGVCTSLMTPGYPNPNGSGSIAYSSCNYDPSGTEWNIDVCVHRNDCGSCDSGENIPTGACDCEGNTFDALGVCGGSCSEDANGDGICDDIYRFVNGSLEVCDDQSVKLYKGVNYSIAGWGGKCWFTDNLRATTYRNGEVIPVANTEEAWKTKADGKLPAVDTRSDLSLNDKAKYGYLYNWYAVDTDELCPSGWHAATDNDWKALELSIGVEPDEVNRAIQRRGEAAAGGYGAGSLLRSGGGLEFNAYPAGLRTDDGKLRSYESDAWLWTSDAYNTIRAQYRDNAIHRVIPNQSVSEGISRYNHSWSTSGSKGYGMTVRCVKD